MRILLAVTVCIGLAATALLLGQPPSPPEACAPSLEQCPEQGCGGDAQLNKLENRTDAATDPDEWTVADVLGLEAKSPKTWQQGSDRAALQAIGEGTRVVLSGYLQNAALEPPQACNCFLANENDRSIRVLLGGQKQTPAAQRVVAVVTARLRHKNTAWQLSKINRAAGQYVRVHGWLLFDSGLAGHAVDDRGSLWEIHPVTNFEVCTESQADCDDGDGWVSLEDYQPQ
jgi:hypothetical protein